MSSELISRCRTLLDSALKPAPQELNELDWKLKLTEHHDNFHKHLSAFSNFAGGGFIVFGINDTNGKVSGLSKSDVQSISEKISNMARTSIMPQITVHPFTFDYTDKTLLGIFIPESMDRPVHTAKNGGIGQAYTRAGGTSRLMDREEIRKAYLTSRPLRFEEQPCVLPKTVESAWRDYFDFSQVISRLKSGSFTSPEAMDEFLCSNKLLVRSGSGYIPTNLAIITCAKDFRSIPNCERFGVRLIEYRGNNKLEAIRDESFSSGYTLCLDQLISRITSLLPHNEIIEQATRKNLPAIPEIALREIIANAVIHRSFFSNDSFISIEIYKDRVEITNPGGLLPEIHVDRLIDHPSKTRNEVLADFMRKLNFAEERGSGIDKAVIACEVYGLPALTFINSNDFFRVTLQMPKSFNDMSRDERINAVYQHTVINYIAGNKTNNTSIRTRFKFNDKQNTKVYRLINDAIDENRIKVANPNDAKKNYHYIPYWL